MAIIPFPMDGRRGHDEHRASERLKAVHCDRVSLDELAADLGTPDEWLSTAISHLKVETSAPNSGTVEVSVAALHLVLMHIEALENGGAPWRRGGDQ